MSSKAERNQKIQNLIKFKLFFCSKCHLKGLKNAVNVIGNAVNVIVAIQNVI